MFASLVLAIAGEFPTYFVLVYVVGLVAAVSLGLVAWYNSKRPVGWERSQRPKFIPKVNTGRDEDSLEPMDNVTLDPPPPTPQAKDHAGPDA